MKSAIEEMYREARGTCNGIKMSPTEARLSDELSDVDDKLLALIRDLPEAMEAYAEVKRLNEALIAEEVFCFYREGFRFGFSMALDVFNV